MSTLLHRLRRQLVKSHRKALSRSLFRASGGAVSHGPFAGLRLSAGANVSSASLGLKLLGLYEEPLMRKVLALTPRDTLVNVGSGDGYYALGLLATDRVRRAVCFEANRHGRAAIARNAAANRVADRLQIRGAAGDDFVDQLGGLGVDWTRALFIIDIEGGEFPLVDEDLLWLTPGAHYLIELHDTAGPDRAARDALRARFHERGWTTEIILDEPRDWRAVESLQTWHDLDRALLVSEGRKIPGEWLWASPRPAAQPT